MNKIFSNTKKELVLFFMLISVAAFANGLSDSILANYFKDTYNIDAAQRAFIEFPRELPGILCVFIIAILSFIGDIRIAFIAQLLSCIGITVLGFFTPGFSIMLIFLFIYSTGMHLFMPLSDSIGMEIAEPNKLGKRVGQYGSLKTAFGFLAGMIVFVGFKFNFFTFKTDVKWVFVISGVCFIIAAVLAFMLFKEHGVKIGSFKKQPISFVLKKEYKYYYILAVLNGVQKQIAYVFGSWVIIDLLVQGADTMSVLTMVGSFMGIFFFKYVGRWIETKGIKFMLYLDALSFIVVYVVYGILVWLIADQILPNNTMVIMFVYVLFILDRLSMQVGVIRSVYLRSIAIVPEDVTRALSTGISLDHIVAIIAAQVSGWIWVSAGPQWVFFFAAFFSLGNLFVATKVKTK